MKARRESQNTQSLGNPDCKDCGLWHSHDDAAIEIEVAELISAFVRALQPDLVIETGCYRGHTTKLIGRALQRNGHGRLVAIDNERKRVRITRRRCVGLPVQVHWGNSLDWLPQKEETIEFALFDTPFEHRRREFEHLHPYCNKWTVVCWHDTGLHFPDPLRPDIEDMAKQGYIQPLFLPTPRGICFARVLK